MVEEAKKLERARLDVREEVAPGRREDGANSVGGQSQSVLNEKKEILGEKLAGVQIKDKETMANTRGVADLASTKDG